MDEPLTCLLVAEAEVGHDGIEVPVIMENVRASEYPQYREATDDEYELYLNYWNGACSVCGRQRGDCQLQH